MIADDIMPSQADALMPSEAEVMPSQRDSIPSETGGTFKKAGYGFIEGGASSLGSVGAGLQRFEDAGPLRNNFENFRRTMDIAGNDVSYPPMDLTTGEPLTMPSEAVARQTLQQQQDATRKQSTAPGRALADAVAPYAEGAKAISEETPGNETAAKAANLVGGMIPLLGAASIPGVGEASAVVLGGLQSTGDTYKQAFDFYKSKGLSDDDAQKAADKDAVNAGLGSAAIYAALPGAGKSVADGLLAKQMEKFSPVVQAAIRTFSQSGQGGLVMGADTLIRDAQAMQSYRPDLTWEQALEEAAEAAGSGALASAAIHGSTEGYHLGKERAMGWVKGEKPSSEPVSISSATNEAGKTDMPPDLVQRAIDRLKSPEEEHARGEQTPASKADVADLSQQVKELQDALKNPFKSSEPTPAPEPAPSDTSQPEPEAAVSSAPAASELPPGYERGAGGYVGPSAESVGESEPLTRPEENAITSAGGSETNTAGTDKTVTQEQSGSPFPGQSGAAIAAEQGSNPRRSPPKLSRGLTEEDGDLFALTQDFGKIPAFIPDGIVKASYARLKRKLSGGGVLTPKERDQFHKLQNIFPPNYEDNWGPNGTAFRRAYDAAKKAGIASEVFERSKRAGPGDLDEHLDFMRNLRGPDYSPEDLWNMVERYSNAHRARVTGMATAEEDAHWSAAQKQEENFKRDLAANSKNTIAIPAEHLQEGDYFTLNGAKLKVENVRFGDDGAVTDLILEDGSRYGTQKIERDENGVMTGLRMDKGSLVHRVDKSQKSGSVELHESHLPANTPETDREFAGRQSGDSPAGRNDDLARPADRREKSPSASDVSTGDIPTPDEIATLKRRAQMARDELGQPWATDPHLQATLKSDVDRLEDQLSQAQSAREKYVEALQNHPEWSALAREREQNPFSNDATDRRERMAQIEAETRESLKRQHPASWRDKANQLADQLELFKSGVGNGGQLHTFGLAADLWDRAVSVAQAVIRTGGTVAEAIDAAIKHVKANFQGRFDEQGARDFLSKNIKPPKSSSGSEYLPGEDERDWKDKKADLDKAEQQMKDAIGAFADPAKRAPGMTKAEAAKARNLAAARYRSAREALLSDRGYAAEQILKNHNAVTQANEMLRPHGMTFNPEDYPNPERVRAALSAQDYQRFVQLQRDAETSHGELGHMNGKLVSSVYDAMQKDGRLPKSKPLNENAGRTLDRMTDFLKSNKIDSPQMSMADRLALGRKFSEGVEKAKGAVNNAWLKAQTLWRVGVESFKSPPKMDDFRDVIKSWIGYDQRTAVENYRYAKALTEKVPNKLRRAAMSVWLDADGDRNLLEAQRQQVPDRFRPAWETALKLTPDEQRIALQVKTDFERKLEDAVNTGLVKQGREDYGVPQRWKKPPEIDRDPAADPQKGSPGNPYAKLDPRDPFFSFRRETHSYFDGIMAGGEPENLDIAHLVTNYDEAFHKALSSRGAIAALQEAVADDGLPVVKISGKASMATGEDGSRAYFVDSKARAPGDVTADGRPYRSLDHFALKDWKVAFKDEKGNPIIVRGDMLIHPDHFDFLKNELETPRWTQQGVGNLALRANTFLKSSKFVGPFHVITEALHATFHGVVPTVRGFDIDLSDPKQALLNRNMMLGFGRARELFEDGLASEKGIWAKVPGLGNAIVKMNNFTFSEYIPRLKMKVGLAVLDRNLERYNGKLTEDQIGELTGRQMDAAFGGQNWRLMGTNKNLLAVARIGLVAPDFLMSRAKVIGQAFKPYNTEQRVFLLAQATGVFFLCRALNLLFSDDHDPHWELKHWDSVVIGNRAYHARFLVSDAANLARDLMGLGSFKQHGVPFITGRLGVAPKMGMEALTGKDLFTGANKDGLFETDNPLLKAFSIVAKDTSEWMTPMAVDGFIGGAAKGQTGLGQVAAATVGISSKKESATGEAYKMAGQFNRSSNDPAAQRFQQERDNSNEPPSDYRILDNLLDAGKLDAAQKAYDALRAGGHSAKSIAAHYDRTLSYTGQQQREKLFLASLNPEQRATYQRAVSERQARAQVFARLQRN